MHLNMDTAGNRRPPLQGLWNGTPGSLRGRMLSQTKWILCGLRSPSDVVPTRSTRSCAVTVRAVLAVSPGLNHTCVVGERHIGNIDPAARAIGNQLVECVWGAIPAVGLKKKCRRR
jgi:hypothetical protein